MSDPTSLQWKNIFYKISNSDLNLCLSFHGNNDLFYFFSSQIIPLLSNST